MYIKVKAQAGAKKEEMVKVDEVTFKVTVKEPAEKNLANKKIAELLARQFACRMEQVRLISGHHSPSKIFSLEI